MSSIRKTGGPEASEPLPRARRQRTASVREEGGAKRSDRQTFFAEPRTPSFSDTPVFVLIDGKPASGAGEFAYDLQAMRRATLVGETTRGAATPGGYRPLAHGFVAFIPMQIVANTVTGDPRVGVGVRPDIEVPADEAMERALRLALEAVLKARGVRRAPPKKVWLLCRLRSSPRETLIKPLVPAKAGTRCPSDRDAGFPPSRE